MWPSGSLKSNVTGGSAAACAQVEISLQPWRAFQPDGVILFSDILTPLTGMNIPFDITAGKGPIIHDPIRTLEVWGAQHASGPPCLRPGLALPTSLTLGMSALSNPSVLQCVRVSLQLRWRTHYVTRSSR